MAKATMNRQSKVGRPGHAKASSPRGAIGNTGGKSGFSERKSIAELAAEQGVRLEGQLDRILGAGAALWTSDEEFHEFVQQIYDRRREGLNLGKP